MTPKCLKKRIDFLVLLGEIRNRIYQHALVEVPIMVLDEPSQTCFATRTASSCIFLVQGPPNGVQEGENMESIIHSHRGFFRLMHTCRQIWSEFCLLYLEAAKAYARGNAFIVTQVDKRFWGADEL